MDGRTTFATQLNSSVSSQSASKTAAHDSESAAPVSSIMEGKCVGVSLMSAEEDALRRMDSTPREDARRAGVTRGLEGPITVPLDVVACIVKHSDFYLLASWRASSRMLFRVVAQHLRSRYVECVGPFVNNVAELDRLLVRHGAVISGSVALRFFLPDATWTPNDLDIYVPESEMQAFVAAATDKDGLKFGNAPESATQPKATQTEQAVTEPEAAPGEAVWRPSQHSGLSQVQKFSTPTDKRVDVICGPSQNPVHSLTRFWTSAVKNFLRPDGASCGFPARTLASKGTMKSALTERDISAQVKYVDRGFVFEAEADGNSEAETSPSLFGASKPMIIPFRRTPLEHAMSFPIARVDRGWIIIDDWMGVSDESTKDMGTARSADTGGLHDE